MSLESIYSPVTKEQSPLAAYLASQGKRKPSNVAGPGQLGGPEIGQGGTFNDPQQSPYAPGSTIPGQSTAPAGGFNPQSPAAAAAAAQAATGGSGRDLEHQQAVDYSSDPALQKILAGNAADLQDAEATALAAQRTALSQYGDRNLASSVLGSGDPTLGSISDDPDKSTSILARLKRGYASTVKDNEDTMNANNLFYSGFRGKRLGDLAKDEQTQEADASSQVQAALDQIAQGLRGTKSSLRDKQIQAESDAATRAAFAAAQAAAAGGGDGSSGASEPAAAPATSSGSAVPSGGSTIPSTPSLPGGGVVTPGGIGTVNPGALGLAGIVNDPQFRALLASLGFGTA